MGDFNDAIERPEPDRSEVRERIEQIIEEKMLDAWNDICADSGCHPLDIKQLGNRVLTFTPGHWSRRTAITAADATLSAGLAPDEISTGDLFNLLLSRINFDGMDPRTFSLAELYRAIDGAEWPK